MILAVDVHYRIDDASVGGVAFAEWSSPQEKAVYSSRFAGVEEYVPGEFFCREFPCILKLLREYRLQPDTVVVEGLVYLDGVSVPGLGKHLYNALGGGTRCRCGEEPFCRRAR